MIQKGSLSSLYDEGKVLELEEKGVAITGKEQKKLEKFYQNKPLFESIIKVLEGAVSDTKYMSPEEFMPVLLSVLKDIQIDKKLLDKIADGLSVMDKEAVIQRVAKGKNKGDIIYDKETKDTEIVRWDEKIEDYMAREVLPHIPDAQWFWEENISAKKPVIKTGAEIPFTRYFYKYQQPEASEVLAERFCALENSVDERIRKLFGKA
jgi:type I restriction enzyme M protein